MSIDRSYPPDAPCAECGEPFIDRNGMPTRAAGMCSRPSSSRTLTYDSIGGKQ